MMFRKQYFYKLFKCTFRQKIITISIIIKMAFGKIYIACAFVGL